MHGHIARRNRSYLCSLTLILFPLVICLGGEYDSAYKKLTWGVNIDEAKKLIDGLPNTYKEPLIDTHSQTYYYMRKAGEVRFDDIYYFEDGRFYEVAWTLDEGIGGNLGMAYYQEFVKRMNSQYTKGRQETLSYGPDGGFGGYITRWETKSIKIQITSGVVYRDVTVIITNKRLENDWKKAEGMEKQKKDQDNANRAKKLFDNN